MDRFDTGSSLLNVYTFTSQSVEPSVARCRLQLLTAVWGPAHEDDVQYLRVFVAQLRQKIEPDPAAPTLITTGDHDDRVVPAHSFKFAAALQAAQQGPAPVLIRVETRAGHGAGKPTAMVIDELTDQYAFLVDALDFEPLAPLRPVP